MRTWLWSGHSFEAGAALPITDRGVRYGMSLFESFPVMDCEPLFLAEHLLRIEESAAQCGWPLPAALLATVGSFIRVNVLHGFVRLYITAGDGTPADPVTAPRAFLMVEERAVSNLEPYKVRISPSMHAPLMDGLKSGNYWYNVQQYQEGLRQGYQETLLFNEHAELISATMANVFMVFGSAIRTPAKACGCRAGVVRQWVMKNFEVSECSLFPEDMNTVCEVFLTSSWHGIIPVGSLQGRDLPQNQVTRVVRERYQAAVAGMLPPAG